MKTDPIARLGALAWRFHRNNKKRVRCPKCGGECWPASGTLSAEFTIKSAASVLTGAGMSDGNVPTPTLLRCTGTGEYQATGCGHTFPMPGDA